MLEHEAIHTQDNLAANDVFKSQSHFIIRGVGHPMGNDRRFEKDELGPAKVRSAKIEGSQDRVREPDFVPEEGPHNVFKS